MHQSGISKVSKQQKLPYFGVRGKVIGILKFRINTPQDLNVQEACKYFITAQQCTENLPPCQKDLLTYFLFIVILFYYCDYINDLDFQALL